MPETTLQLSDDLLAWLSAAAQSSRQTNSEYIAALLQRERDDGPNETSDPGSSAQQAPPDQPAEIAPAASGATSPAAPLPLQVAAAVSAILGEREPLIGAIAQYASFEQWFNTELFWKLKQTLEDHLVEAERWYPNGIDKGRGDVAIDRSDNDFWIECKQIWRPGNWGEQLKKAKSDRDRVAKAGGGMLIVLCGSTSPDNS